jgi:hypothetical protein
MEKRKHPRIIIDDMTIDVSDGIGFCTGEVRDISRLGMCLVNLARRLGKNTDAYTVVASREGKHFKFRVRPKWVVNGPYDKKVGVEIDNVPAQWTEYVIALEPEAGEGSGSWNRRR